MWWTSRKQNIGCAIAFACSRDVLGEQPLGLPRFLGFWPPLLCCSKFAHTRLCVLCINIVHVDIFILHKLTRHSGSAWGTHSKGMVDLLCVLPSCLACLPCIIIAGQHLHMSVGWVAMRDVYPEHHQEDLLIISALVLLINTSTVSGSPQSAAHTWQC